MIISLTAVTQYVGDKTAQIFKSPVSFVCVSMSEKHQKLHGMFHLDIDLAVLMNVAGIWSAFKIDRSGSVLRPSTLGVASLLLRWSWKNHLQNSSVKLKTISWTTVAPSSVVAAGSLIATVSPDVRSEIIIGRVCYRCKIWSSHGGWSLSALSLG